MSYKCHAANTKMEKNWNLGGTKGDKKMNKNDEKGKE